MTLTFRPMTPADVQTFIAWRYDPPYDIYNIIVTDQECEGLVSFYVDPANRAYAIDDEYGVIAAFCSFGADGQVPGGDYSADALDIGMGVRPDLTGQGLGQQFANAVIDFAQCVFTPPLLRVTIASFNLRAQRVWVKLGFRSIQEFQPSGDGMPFVIFTRNADLM